MESVPNPPFVAIKPFGARRARGPFNQQLLVLEKCPRREERRHNIIVSTTFLVGLSPFLSWRMKFGGRMKLCWLCTWKFALHSNHESNCYILVVVWESKGVKATFFKSPSAPFSPTSISFSWTFLEYWIILSCRAH